MKRTIHKDYIHLDRFVANLPTGLFAYTGLTVQDGRDCVKVLTEDGEKIVVKKFRRPNRFNRIVHTLFRGSRAHRAYHNALQLQRMGVNTPRPIGFIDVKENGLVAGSYLATGYTDYEPIGNLIDGSESGNEVLFNCFVRFMVTLHEKGISHNNYAANVLYKKRIDGRYDFALTDVCGVKFGPMSMNDSISDIRHICADQDFTLQFARKYAELRNWNVYRFIAGTSVLRLLFERRRVRMEYLKEVGRRMAHA